MKPGRFPRGLACPKHCHAAHEWTKVLGVGLLVFLGAELEKAILRHSTRLQRWVGLKKIASSA